MAHHTVKLGERGRLVIPAETRAKLGLKAGDRLVVSERDGELRLLPVAARVRALRGAWSDLAPDRGLVEELIADRRAEGELE
jgi:AbrB family looped-hinge helix DNA binding protein